MKSKPKQPPGKPGGRKPGVRPTLDEIEKRVDDVEVLMARQARKSQIHSIICKKYNCDWRTVDNYVNRARARLLLRLNETKTEHRSKSLALYQQVIVTGTPREKILAQERIDKLLGLEAPRLFGHGGAEGMPPIKTETEDKTVRPMKGVAKADLLAVIALAKSAKKK